MRPVHAAPNLLLPKMFSKHSRKTVGVLLQSIHDKITLGSSDCELTLGEFSGDIRELLDRRMWSGGSLGVLCIHDGFPPNPTKVCDN